MDRSMKLLDQQMIALEQIKQMNRGNNAVKRTVDTQKSILKAQKRELRLMRKKKGLERKAEKKRNKRFGGDTDTDNKPDTSINNMFPVLDYREK